GRRRERRFARGPAAIGRRVRAAGGSGPGRRGGRWAHVFGVLSLVRRGHIRTAPKPALVPTPRPHDHRACRVLGSPESRTSTSAPTFEPRPTAKERLGPPRSTDTSSTSGSRPRVSALRRRFFTR